MIYVRFIQICNILTNLDIDIWLDITNFILTCWKYILSLQVDFYFIWKTVNENEWTPIFL